MIPLARVPLRLRCLSVWVVPVWLLPREYLSSRRAEMGLSGVFRPGAASPGGGVCGGCCWVPLLLLRCARCRVLRHSLRWLPITVPWPGERP